MVAGECRVMAARIPVSSGLKLSLSFLMNSPVSFPLGPTQAVPTRRVTEWLCQEAQLSGAVG